MLAIILLKLSPVNNTAILSTASTISCGIPMGYALSTLSTYILQCEYQLASYHNTVIVLQYQRENCRLLIPLSITIYAVLIYDDSFYTFSPDDIRLHKCTEVLLAALVNRDVCSKSLLMEVWKEDKKCK